MVAGIVLGRQRSKVNALSFSDNPSEPQIAVGGNDTGITIWNSLNGQFDNIFIPSKFSNCVELNHTNFLLWVHHSSKLFSAHTSGQIYLWDTNIGSMVSEFDYHKASVLSMTINPQMNTLCSGGYDKLLVFWDIDMFKFDFSIQSLCSPISSIDFSFDGIICAVSGYNATCRLFDMVSQLIAFSICRNSHTKYIKLSFSPNSLYIALVTECGIVELWDLRNQMLLKIIKTFENHNETKNQTILFHKSDEEFHIIGYNYSNECIELLDLQNFETKKILGCIKTPRNISYDAKLKKIAIVLEETPNQAILCDIMK